MDRHNGLVAERDWYAELALSPDASEPEIAAAVERKSRQATAMANTDPERSQRLRDLVRAIKADLMSGPEQRRAYDERRAGSATASPVGTTAAAPAAPPASAAPAAPAAPPAPTAPPAAPGGGVRRGFLRFLQSGWACPNCGEGAMPSDKVCPRCGTPIPRPAIPLAQQTCPACGAGVAQGHRFCGSCGRPLT